MNEDRLVLNGVSKVCDSTSSGAFCLLVCRIFVQNKYCVCLYTIHNLAGFRGLLDFSF